MEITPELTILVRAPLRFPEKDIDALLIRHRKWIEKATARRLIEKEKYPEPDETEIKRLIEKAKQVLPVKVEFFSGLTGLIPTGVRITGAKKRFGSCSGKNSLCFSYYLMRYPEPCIDYVVLHEVAHIKHHNHSKEFYALIEKYMPDYRQRVKMLKS